LRQWITFAALALLASCVQHRYEPIKDELAKAIVYAEQHGDEWTMHSYRTELMPDPPVRPTGPADQNPGPALVDVDSTLHIYVEPRRVALDKGGRSLDEEFQRVTAKRMEFEGILAEIEEVSRVRQEALSAYHTGNADFKSIKNAFGDAEEKLIDTLLDLSDHEEDIENAVDESADTYEGLRGWFKGYVTELNESYVEFEEDVKKQSVGLRLEAWLHQGGTLTPVHVPGYDSLEEGRIQVLDRWGLDLSPTEQSKLDDEVARTYAAAKRANEVLRGEKQLVEALAETVSEELKSTIADIDALIKMYSKGQLRSRLRKLHDESKEFWSAIQTKADGLQGQAKDDLDDLPNDFELWMKKEASSVQTILDLLAEFSSLRDRWKGLSFAEFAKTFEDTIRALKKLKSVNWPDLVSDAEKAAVAFLDGKSQAWDGAAFTALTEVRDSPEGVAFFASVAEIYKDLGSVVTKVTEIREKVDKLMGGVKGKGVLLTTVPESLLVPLSELKDTKIDLFRTARSNGDQLTVRATRFKAGDQVDQTAAEFKVRRFGWYAELSPAVVLVKPRNLAGDNDGYRFAPTLSWLHHYVPRPGETTDWINALQPSIGIHAAFLSFDTDTSDAVQVGLGATAALWDGRLQAGIGYNFMADTGDEGRIYYFVGTDLIGLLQSIGVGN
jgi:hypothetical protein